MSTHLNSSNVAFCSMVYICGSPRWKSNIILLCISIALQHLKHYSAELPLKGGAHAHWVNTHHICTVRMSPVLNRASAL